MIVLFVVVANTVIQCFGMRFCDDFSPVELVRLWQAGFIEIMFENALVKVYRRVRDKLPTEDREDKKLDV